MNTSAPQTELLDQLRDAAEARDPERRQFLLKSLFLQLDFYLAAAVAVERARAFLEAFEAYYPDAVFARRILTQMVNTGQAPSRLPPEALRDFDAPGAANFMKALADLAQALGQGALPARIGSLVSATVNANMAELVEHYYGRRPKAWEIARGNPDDPQARAIAYAFWTDEETALLDIDHWLEVADAIDGHLQRQFRSADARARPGANGGGTT